MRWGSHDSLTSWLREALTCQEAFVTEQLNPHRACLAAGGGGEQQLRLLDQDALASQSFSLSVFLTRLVKL